MHSPPASKVAATKDERLTMAEVLRACMPAHVRDHKMPMHHWRTLRALMACRTPALGAHVYRCAECGREHFVPHSCRNRHCPTCQPARGAEWMSRQCELLLPIPYFHIVFTLPHQLNALIVQNQAALYKLLFDAASATLLEFGRNRFKAVLGITSVLHTWGQTLNDHYHLHCIVTGGGLSSEGSQWISAAKHWLFPVRALSKVYRGKFCSGLRALHERQELEFHGHLQDCASNSKFDALLRDSCRRKWVVHAKRPFNGPETVLAYLARYTHRVGLSDARLAAFDERKQTVSFRYKDYAHASEHKTMTLGMSEFVRRFRLHILPPKFTKIRHYGLLANRGRTQRIEQARVLLDTRAANTSSTMTATHVPLRRQPEPMKCPFCQDIRLVLIRVITAPGSRAPAILDSS